MRTEADAIQSMQRFIAGVLPDPWDIRRTVEVGLEPERPYALIEQVGQVNSDGGKNLQDITVAYSINAYLERGETRQAADDAAMAVRESVFQAVKWGADAHRPTTDRIPLYSYDPRLEVQRVKVRGATAGAYLIGDPTGTDWTDPIAFDADGPAIQASLDAAFPASTLVEKRSTGWFDIHFIGDNAGQPQDLLQIDDSDLVAPTSPSVTRVMLAAPAPWRTPSDFLTVTSFAQTTLRDQQAPELVMVAIDLRCTFARGLRLPFGQMLLQTIRATGSSGG